MPSICSAGRLIACKSLRKEAEKELELFGHPNNSAFPFFPSSFFSNLNQGEKMREKMKKKKKKSLLFLGDDEIR